MNPPPLVPARPPIRVEDGLVEVGWEGDLDAEPPYEEESARPPESPCPDDSSFNEELVEDRYAALQAWHEWTRNQGRGDTDSDPTQLESSPADEATELEAGISNAISTSPPSAAAESSVARSLANIRAEPQQEFAPYSQLFTRLRQSRVIRPVVAPRGSCDPLLPAANERKPPDELMKPTKASRKLTRRPSTAYLGVRGRCQVS